MRRPVRPSQCHPSSVIHALGTDVRITVSPASQQDHLRDELQTWLETVEAAASRFRPDSELNQLAKGSSELPSDLLKDLADAAQRIERLTSGIVTPRIRLALEVAGYDRSFDALKSTATQRQPGVCGSDAHAPWSNLDFGGTGKGWAVDCALEQMRGRCDGALIDAGGDIGVFGPAPDGGPWRVSLPGPGSGDVIIHLRSGGIATSSVRKRNWRDAEGRFAHHLIDPATGRPSNSDIAQATVWARDTLSAEVAAKSLVIRGSGLVPTVRDWFPEAVLAWTTTNDEFLCDPAFETEVLACSA